MKYSGKGKGGGDREEGSDDEERPQKQAKTELPRNDIWREEGSWEMKNESYEAYYQKQGVCPAEDWPKLVQALRTGLPVAIRVNRMRLGATSLCNRLQEMREACLGNEAREQFAPIQLSWYPHDSAWHWPSLERRTVKKNKRNVQLKEYLMHRERSGLISRQEVVSMIPPLFLGVEPDHMVLDLCAAPGSKTSQMLEIMHWPQDGKATRAPKGMVLANELQWKRANMLAHQVSRLGSPCAVVVNMDAQFFPELWDRKASGEASPLRFDRILADVPCSGDGTMRKTPYIWKSWTLRDGLSLHIRQLGILNRGLDLLKVGGRIVYSTCSLNPAEDESVVAAALQRHGGAVVLVPPPDLKGLNAAHGLDKWIIQDTDEGPSYESYESVPKELKEGKCRILPSMFPPTGEGSEEILASVKQHCRRFLPHLMDTGGFFAAILEKRSDLKPSAKARRDERREKKQAQKAEQETVEVASIADATSVPNSAAEPSSTVSTGVGSVGDPVAGPSIVAEPVSGPPQGLRCLTKEYVAISGEMWQEIRDFYGFDEANAAQFVQRNDTDARVFLMSEGVARLMKSEVKLPTRMVLCGVTALERAKSSHMDACEWRLVQQGVSAIGMLGLKRRIVASKDFILRLLREKELSLAEVIIAHGAMECIAVSHGPGTDSAWSGKQQQTMRSAVWRALAPS